MRELTLINTRKVALIDSWRYEETLIHRWRLGPRLNDYITSSTRPHIPLHEFLFGKAPGKLVWDHRDRNKLNNQEYNLRLATNSQNICNRNLLKTNTSGYIGVDFFHGKWRSRISNNGHRILLGYWDYPEEAAHARDHVASRLQGKFAVLNFRVQ